MVWRFKCSIRIYKGKRKLEVNFLKDNGEKNSILEAALLVLVMSLFTLIGIYFIPYLLILFPTGFIIFALRRNMVLSGISMIGTTLVISLVVGWVYSVFLLIMFLPISMCLAYLIKRRRKSLEILGFSTIVFFVSLLIILSFVDSTGIGFVTQLEQSFKDIMETQINMFKDMDLTSYELAETKDLLESAYRYIILIVPTILLISSLVVSYLNYLTTSVGLKKMRIEIVGIPQFSKFRLPNNIIPGVLVMFLVTYIAGKLDFKYLDTINLNLVALVGFMFFIQGLSVLEHLFKKLKMFVVFRIILYIVFLFTAFMLTAISVLGILDIVFDFRKLRRPKSS